MLFPSRDLGSGLCVGIEKGIEKTILSAYDNGIDLKIIRLISGEKIEKIKEILAKNERS